MNIRSASTFRRLYRKAFTLIELLVVIGIIAILTALLLTSLHLAKSKAKEVQCLNNMRQLVVAWQLYAADNNEALAYNADFRDEKGWIKGTMRFNDWPDNTNTAYLLDPQHALLGGYTRSAAIYRCSEDQSKVTINGTVYPRVRSISMSMAMNSTGFWLLPSGGTKVFRKTSDIRELSPSDAFVFIDENPDGINDGAFGVKIIKPNELSEALIVDFPATFHSGASVMSFADGSAARHKWRDTRTAPKVNYSNVGWKNMVPTPGNVDMLWLAQHTSVLY